MYKYLMFLLCLSLFACAESVENGGVVDAGQYIPKNNSAILDHQCQPIITQYQELLKGLSSRDTAYIANTSNLIIHLNDSLASLKLVSDSNLKKIWVDGLVNMNAELVGVLAANTIGDDKELNMSVHMTGIQLLSLLGQIGYKEHTIYVFNVTDSKSEDGYTWLGLQKITKDPFHSNNRKEMSAVQVLQEAK